MFGTNRTAEQRLQDIAILILAAGVVQIFGMTLAPKGAKFLPPFVYMTTTENFAVTSEGIVVKNPIAINEPGVKITRFKLNEGTYFSLDERGRVQYRVKVDPTGHIDIVRIPRGP